MQIPIKIVRVLFLGIFSIFVLASGCSSNRDIDPLIHDLGSEDPFVQMKAVNKLGKMHNQEAIEKIASALTSDQLDVRQGAAQALGKSRSPFSVDALALALNDHSISTEALASLSAVGKPAIEPIISALRHSDVGIQGGAAIALGKLEDARAVEPLISLIQDKSVFETVRQDAAWALMKMRHPKGNEALLAAMNEDDLRIITGAYYFFMKQKSETADSLLVEALYAYGNADMALAFIQSSHRRLKEAGKKWAAENGYKLQHRFGPGKK